MNAHPDAATAKTRSGRASPARLRPGSAMTRNWIAVACAEHVARGRAGGFIQVGHGKAAPLGRLRAGDRVVTYSPTTVMEGGDRLQAFTAIGIVKDARIYPFDMGNGFVPFRRDVTWLTADRAPIQPLLPRLDLTRGKRNWGHAFRLGLIEVTEQDFATIAAAMGTAVPGLQSVTAGAPL
jgi:hypothetical protein